MKKKGKSEGWSMCVSQLTQIQTLGNKNVLGNNIHSHPYRKGKGMRVLELGIWYVVCVLVLGEFVVSSWPGNDLAMRTLSAA